MLRVNRVTGNPAACASLCAALVCFEPAPPPLSAAPPQASIVFERSLRGNMDIYMLPLVGGVETRLTNDPAEDALPRFTNGGRSVLFSSKRTGEWQIWEVDAEGGPARRVRTTAAREWQADRAADGRLTFLSNAGGVEALFVERRPGVGAYELLRHEGPRTVILGNPNWSPDGRQIVFSSNEGLAGHRTFVVDAASGKARRVSPLTSGACEPRFGRDGKSVVYVRRQHLTRERSLIVQQSLEDGSERVLVDWPALNYDPVLSPDGSELAFTSTIAGGDFAIYRMRLADGQSWRLTFGAGVARHPDYRP